MEEDHRAAFPGDQETRGYATDLHLFLVELPKWPHEVYYPGSQQVRPLKPTRGRST
jgi:hypothetical protein